MIGVMMKHRHLNNNEFTLVAIDSFINSGRVHDWIELKAEVERNPILLLEILHICIAQKNDPCCGHRYAFWRQYVVRRLLNTTNIPHMLDLLERYLDGGVHVETLEKVVLRYWERYHHMVNDTKISHGFILTTGFLIAVDMYRQNVIQFRDCGDYEHAKAVQDVLNWLESLSLSTDSSITVPFPDEVSTVQLRNWLMEVSNGGNNVSIRRT